jgi:hypothetical protein
MSESPVEDKLQAKTQHGNTMQNDDARLKLIWDSIMVDVGKKTVYRTVSVLLISWDDDAGDLKTGQEVRCSFMIEVTPDLTTGRLRIYAMFWRRNTTSKSPTNV